jgi:hypothetical protein
VTLIAQSPNLLSSLFFPILFIINKMLQMHDDAVNARLLSSPRVRIGETP